MPVISRLWQGELLRPSIKPLLIANQSPLPNAVINKSYSATFTSTGGLAPFSWSVISGTLPNGLSLSTAGVLSGTPTSVQSSTFKVRVTDSQTPTAAIEDGTFMLTVNDVLAVSTTSLTAGTVNIPYQGFLSATGGVPPYTWTITAGSLPAGLTLATNGLISGTPTATGTSSFTVQVTDSESPAVTATGNVSLTINGSDNRLNGNYAFTFRGFNQGNVVVAAGSFVSDGAGNITGGVADFNSASGPQTNVAFAGTYSLDDNGHGTMTLNFGPLGTFSYQLVNSTFGYTQFIQNGNSNDTATRGVGIIKQQTTKAFTLTSLAGNWSFGGVGADSSGGRYGAVGSLTLSNTGTVSNGIQDTNDAGTLASSQSISGSLSAPDANTGRATGQLGTANQNFAFYVVSGSEMIAISIDPVGSQVPLVLDSALRQGTGPVGFSNAYLNGAVVLEVSGVGSVNSSPVPDVTLGIATFDGQGAYTAKDDENLGGTLSQSSPSGTFNVSANGRTTITGIGTTPPVIYLSSFNAGFVLGNDASVGFGNLEAQFGGPFSNTSFSGSYAGGSLLPVLSSVTVDVDLASADGASSNATLTLNYDSTGPGGSVQGQTLTATYNVDSTGRFPLTVNGSTAAIGYVVNPNRVVVLGGDANPKINALQK